MRLTNILTFNCLVLAVLFLQATGSVALAQGIKIATYSIEGQTPEKGGLSTELNSFFNKNKDQKSWNIQNIAGEEEFFNSFMIGNIPKSGIKELFEKQINLFVWFTSDSLNENETEYTLHFTRIYSETKFEEDTKVSKTLPDTNTSEQVMIAFEKSIIDYMSCNDHTLGKHADYLSIITKSLKDQGMLNVQLDTFLLHEIAPNCPKAMLLLARYKKYDLRRMAEKSLLKKTETDSLQALNYLLSALPDTSASMRIGDIANSKWICEVDGLAKWWWHNLDKFWQNAFKEDVFGNHEPTEKEIIKLLFSPERPDGDILKLPGDRAYENLNGLEYLQNIFEINFSNSNSNKFSLRNVEINKKIEQNLINGHPTIIKNPRYRYDPKDKKKNSSSETLIDVQKIININKNIIFAPN